MTSALGVIRANQGHTSQVDLDRFGYVRLSLADLGPRVLHAAKSFGALESVSLCGLQRVPDRDGHLPRQCVHFSPGESDPDGHGRRYWAVAFDAPALHQVGTVFYRAREVAMSPG